MGCCGSRENNIENKCDDYLIENKNKIKKEINDNIGFCVLYSVTSITTGIIAGVCSWCRHCRFN